MTRNEKPWTHYSWIELEKSLRRHRDGLRLVFEVREACRPNLLFLHAQPIANRQPLTGMTRSPMMNKGGRTRWSALLTGRD